MDGGVSARAAIYCRKSQTSRTREVQQNLDDQLKDCRELAKERGYSVVAEYEETAPGTDRERPGYLELCRKVKHGEIDVVLAVEEERLYRGFAVLPFHSVVMENEDVDIELVRGHWSRRDMAIKAGIAQQEIERTRDRTMRGRYRELEAGKPPGGPLPYGYQRIEEKGPRDGYPEINEVEARGVRKVLTMYADGRTHIDIKNTLNEAGISPRKDNDWSLSSVRNIIYDSDAYASGERIATLEDTAYTIEYPPIIDKELAARCRRRRMKNKASKGTRTRTGTHLLRGLLYCPCGWRMSIRHDKRWPNNDAYRCQRPGHDKPQDPTCPNRIRQDQIDPLVWDEVVQTVLNPDRLRGLIEERIEADSEEAERLQTELDALESTLERQQKEREWIINQGQAELLSTEEMKSRLRSHDQKLAGIEAEASKVRGQLAEVRGELSAIEVASKTIGEEAEQLAPLDVEITEDDLLAVPPRIAAVAPWDIRTKDGEGLFVRREDVAASLGNPDDLVQAQVKGSRALLERYVEGVYAVADDSERGWSVDVELVFHWAARDKYSGDWWRK